MVGGGSLDTPPQLLNAENYIYWKKHFELFLKAKHPAVWNSIEFGDYNIPNQDNVRHHCMAMHLLWCALPHTDFRFIYRCATAQDMWKTLEIVYEGNTEVKDSKILLLTKKLETFEMFKGESVHSMSRRLKDIICQLTALGQTYPDEVYVRSIINALPPQWNLMATTLRCKDLSVLSLEDAIGSLKVFAIDQEREKLMSRKRSAEQNE